MDVCRAESVQFSVIIPVYNTQDYIDATIQSVLDQSFSNYEIVIVDDGSTDKSGQICEAWAKKDSRIMVHHQKNQGQIAAREMGIKKSRGEYVIFLDSDDLLVEGMMQLLASEIESSHADCLIYGYQKLENGILGVRYVDNKKTALSEINAVFSKILSDSTYNSMCRKAFRRDILSENDYRMLYHLRHGEDLVQSLIILKNCRTVLFLDRVLYTYRIISTSISHNRRLENFTDSFGAREAVYQLLNEYKEINDDTKICFKTYCIKQFIGVIFGILCLNIERHEKIESLKKMKDSTWYSQYISSNNDICLSMRERFVLWLFDNKYWLVLLLLEQYRNIHH